MPKVNVKDKRRQQLIDANMVSIAKRGLVDTTIAHVSDGANMSRGIVNFYFTTKEKMMQDTLAFLMNEQNICWQEALAEASEREPMARVEAMMRALMSDKLCSVRRLAVLSAFIGHAGTHAGYAKLIRAADDLFIKQVKILLQQAGTEARIAELRARQLSALIRGHHVTAFLNSDWGKPSSFGDFWAEVVSGWGGGNALQVPREKYVPPEPVQAEAVAQVAAPEPVAVVPASKPKKPHSPHVLPGQLDFGDLFARK